MTATGWTPLADGPPPGDGKYLVFCPSANPNDPMIALAWWYADGGWSALSHIWIDDITHWMPLPPPPGPSGGRADP